MGWVTVVSGLFAVVGAALIVAASHQFFRRRDFVRHSATASGTIVAVAETRDRDEISFFPEVTFEMPSGRRVTFRSQMGSTRAGRIGEIVAVRYRRNQPEIAEIDSFMSMWGLTLLFALLGAVFLFVGLGILSGLIRI